jgi:hypothetical protein
MADDSFGTSERIDSLPVTVILQDFAAHIVGEAGYYGNSLGFSTID